MGIFSQTCGATRRTQKTVKSGKKYQVIKEVKKCHLPKKHKGSHVFS